MMNEAELNSVRVTLFEMKAEKAKPVAKKCFEKKDERRAGFRPRYNVPTVYFPRVNVTQKNVPCDNNRPT